MAQSHIEVTVELKRWRFGNVNVLRHNIRTSKTIKNKHILRDIIDFCLKKYEVKD